MRSNVGPENVSIRPTGEESAVVTTFVIVRPVVLVLVPSLQVEPLRSTRVGLNGKQQVLDALERNVWSVRNH